MHSSSTLAVASSLLGLTTAATLDPRILGAPTSATTCATNQLAFLMKLLPAYAAPFCLSAVKVAINTPVISVTVTPTVTQVGTAYKTVTTTNKAGTTTVALQAKRTAAAAAEAGHQLEERTLIDFPAYAVAAGLNLAVSAVSSGCSCFSATYTAPAVTQTITAATVTASVTMTTLQVTTTIKGVTV